MIGKVVKTMQLIPGIPNAINCDNLYIFFNFTKANMAYVRTIDPLSVPAFHVFIHSNANDADNEALTELLLTCTDLTQRWRKPIKVTLYSPMRHTVLRNWIEKYYGPYRKLYTSVFVGNSFSSELYKLNHQPFAAAGNELNERLIVEYDMVHRGNQTMSVSWEGEGHPREKLATYVVNPADDWLTSGYPGIGDIF